MKNQIFNFGIVMAFLLFMFFLNVLCGQSSSYLERCNTTFESKDEYTKKLNLKPKSSQSFSLKLDDRKFIKVQISSGDLGSGRIVAEVYDPSGNRFASESNEFSFETKNIKGNYKFVVTNKTKDHQSVKVSVNVAGT